MISDPGDFIVFNSQIYRGSVSLFCREFSKHFLQFCRL